jgi:chromosome partition protein MukE
MEDDRYRNLEEVVTDPLFPSLDHRLRGGAHVDGDDIAEYEFLIQAVDLLQGFYGGYQCRLVHGAEGYWYLLPEGELLGRRRLGTAEMLLGQVRALMRMDPAWLTETGWIPRARVLETLENLLGRERLVALLAPRARTREHHADDRRIREAVDKALNAVESLGFVRQRRETGEVLPRRSLMRFVAPVRGAGDPREALERLMREGEVELAEPDADGDADADTGEDDAESREDPDGS